MGSAAGTQNGPTFLRRGWARRGARLQGLAINTAAQGQCARALLAFAPGRALAAHAGIGNTLQCLSPCWAHAVVHRTGTPSCFLSHSLHRLSNDLGPWRSCSRPPTCLRGRARLPVCQCTSIADASAFQHWPAGRAAQASCLPHTRLQYYQHATPATALRIRRWRVRRSCDPSAIMASNGACGHWLLLHSP